ncbi:MAG: BLUF domain-containing protein [Wenzhouxiangellaceae bacterium]
MLSEDHLIALSYCSRASFPAAHQGYGVDPEVSRILVCSRRNNQAVDVGGVLHFGNGMFFQYLEGPADRVDALYARICRDPRHHDVQRLTRRTIRNRRFTDWSMKFVAIERLVSQVLRRHDLEAFDPYRFTPALIDDLVISCIAGPDSVPDAEQQIAEPARRPPLWRRLLGWY